MGTKINCDICFADIPIVENIQKVEIGGNLVAETCHSCASKVKGVIQAQVGEAAKQMAVAQQEVAAPMQQPAPAAAPAAAPAPAAPAAPAQEPKGPAGPGGQ